MIQTEKWCGLEVYKIETKEIAVWVSLTHGGNIYRIKDKMRGIELLHAPATPDLLTSQPEYWGTPVLFPPNRIAHGKFDFKGQKFRLPINTPEGHHSHGLILNRAWRFDALSDADEVLSLHASLNFIDYPEILECYPNHLNFSMKITVQGAQVKQKISVVNKGKSEAPVGVGLHTWFHLAGGRDRWRATLPFAKIWELGDDIMPTEKLLDAPGLDELRSGMCLREKNFDTIFQIGQNLAQIEMVRDDGYRLLYAASDSFRHWILHTPLQLDDVIAVEPYTWVTNAPNLTLSPDITGFRSIGPNEVFECWTNLSVG